MAGLRSYRQRPTSPVLIFGSKVFVSVVRKDRFLQGLRIGHSSAATWISSLAGPMLAKRGIVTYATLSEQRLSIERRTEVRRRVHLRSGKILNCKNQFLTECLFKNRTRFGTHLQLAVHVPLPRSIQLYDDHQSTLVNARVIWQRGRNAGCRVMSASNGSNEKLIGRLGGRYYAVQ